MPELISKGGPLVWLLIGCLCFAVAVFFERLSYYHRATMNIGEFRVENGPAKLGTATIPLSRETLGALTDADGGKINLGFRPEALDIADSSVEGAFPVQVNLVEELGSDAFLYGELAGDSEAAAHLSSGAGDAQMIVRVDPRNVPEKGSKVYVKIRTGEQHHFSSATGLRLPA